MFTDIDTFRQNIKSLDIKKELKELKNHKEDLKYLYEKIIKNSKRKETKHHAFFFSNFKCFSHSENDNKFHAEVNAFKKIKFKNFKCRKSIDLLVLSVSKIGKFGIYRPCYHCLKYLEGKRIKLRNIYYSTDEGEILCEKFKDMLDLGIYYICKRKRTFGNNFKIKYEINIVVNLIFISQLLK